ncbi:O-antigen/teichoic acid export membrane protein [Blastococcus colisei]|uniref:O-antigen/teichoic acid export membrane protein n=2 Tax=Blastococcus colisei TaxID=1564162 RepID=A0A543P1C1_9ACTN|nr:O-antigen/teichoic acid export membrane protein [Blastococcus colisei]
MAAAPDDAPGVAGGVADTGEMRRTQVRGSTLLVVGRILALLLTTTTQIVLVRALTMSDFGAFGYALAIASAGRLLLSLGQGKLLSRFTAKYEEERDYDRMFGSMILAAGTILLTSTVSLVALFMLADALVGSAVSDPATVKVVLILVFLAPLEAFDQVFVSLFAAFSKPRAIFFRKYLLTPSLRLAVVLILALTGSSVTFLAIGYVAAGVVGLALNVTLFAQVLRERDLLRHLRLRRVVLPYRAVFSFSLPLITGELLTLSLTVGGVFILAYYHSAAEVAGYRAVFNPARLNTAVLHAFVPMFLPLAARLFARSDIDGLRRTYWQTGAFVAVLTFPVFGLTGPMAEDTTVLLFGEAYADSGLVLALLSAGYYFSVVLGFNTYALQICGRIRFLVGVNTVTAVFNVALSLLLVQRYAAVGIAIANLSALVLQNVVNQWALRRALGTSFIDRRCALCYLVILCSAAALWAFQVLVDPGLVLGLASVAVASVVVLVVSRRAIELGDTFPELRRVPVLRLLVP